MGEAREAREGREGKGREGKGREGQGREGKRKEAKGREELSARLHHACTVLLSVSTTTATGEWVSGCVSV